MPRMSPLIESFGGGELSPLLMGRVSTDLYKASSDTMENFYPDSRGGAKRRGGTQYVTGVKDKTKPTRLIPFTVSTLDSYVLELGNLYMRFYSDSGQVESSPSVPLEIVTPWDENQIWDLQFAQSNDVMYITHPAFQPRKLTRTGAAAFTLGTVTWGATNPVAHWLGNADGHADGFPRSVSFFQQRLFFGGSTLKPNTLWGSKTADFENFGTSTTLVDDDAVAYSIASYTNDTIQWLGSGTDLLIGTSGSVWRLRVSGYLGAVNAPEIARAVGYGSKFLMPAYVDTQLMFIDKGGRQVRNIDLSRGGNSSIYQSRNLIWQAEHLSYSGIVDMAYTQTPDSVLWAVRADGKLLSCTYDPSLEDDAVIGWAQHPMANGIVESVAAIPNGEQDQLWLVVKRTIDGVEERYVEFMDHDIFVDSGIGYNVPATPISIVSNLDHLEGEEVTILAEGAVHPNQTVSSGQVVLNAAYGVIEIGLAYNSKIVPVPVEGGNPNGTSQGKAKRWNHAIIKLYQSANPKVNGSRPPSRSPASPMDAPEPLVTGESETYHVGYDHYAQLTIEQDLPLACHVLAIYGNMGVHTG